MKTTDFINQDWVKEEINKRITYYPDTGLLVWKPRKSAKFNDKFAGKTVGHVETLKCGYIYQGVHLEIKGRKVNIPAGRVAWLLQTGDWPEHTIDHENRDSTDNTWLNLRDVTQAVNNENRREYRKGFSKNLKFSKGCFWEVVIFGRYFGQSTCFGKALRIREQARKELGLEPMLTKLVGR
jgi:hypothetical protein